MNPLRGYYTMEVSVVLPKWEDVAPSVVSPPGDRLGAVGPRAYRALARTGDLSLMVPVVNGYPKGSGFVRDRLELEHRIA